MKIRINHMIALFTIIPALIFSQIEQWVYRYDGSYTDQDIAHAIVYGLDCNIYAAGVTVNMGTGSDLIVVNLKDNGDTNWMYIYDGTGYGDMATSLVYGADNNIYVAGQSGTQYTYSDFLVISLTTSGDTNWTFRYDGPASAGDAAYSIAYGQDGNIYVAGKSPGVSTSDDIFVVSLSSAGDTNWTYRYSGSGVSYDRANSIVYGADGNIYVAGVCCGETTSWDFFVMSLSPVGDTNWTYRYDGGQSYDLAYSITYGLDGQVYAAGYSTGAGGQRYFTVISLTSEGDENWIYTFQGDGADLNIANSIVYGEDNNIYVAGMCSWAMSGHDFTVLSLNTAGDTNWTYRLQGAQDFDDDAKALVYGSDGNIYAAGTVVDGVSARDFVVVSLAADGTTNWLYSYTTAPTYWWDEAYAIAYGLDDKVYAAGYSIDSTGIHLWDFTVISLDPAIGIEETKTIAANAIATEAVPNPFTHFTDIRCQVLDDNPEYDIGIYDITGRLVANLSAQIAVVDHELSVRWDGCTEKGKRLPGGVYFVRIRNSDYIVINKLLLVR
jgi:uncharacterized delta-60 repeat protein